MLQASAAKTRRLLDRLFAPDILRSFADLMDNRYTLPGTRLRVGWDFIIGLIPIAGDLVVGAMACYVLLAAVWHRVGAWVILKMLFNLLVDIVIGVVPVLGDLFDAHWRVNIRNVTLLLDAIERRQYS